MKYLLESQISSNFGPGKSIEQYVDRIEQADYSILRWVAIERTKDIYTLVIHEVFDERNEVQSIYDFTYLEPDDMHGKRIANFESLKDAFEMAEKEFGTTPDKYLTCGFLNKYLESQGK
ncbi:hypothetical protein [Pedobacter paludis]|uniref:Uncharacterized protein n=1 Tax=Pedobacter paludis TaxID=2203212 RepID=A0A317F0L9_9SPHI|nr:hypothetical protein [Pedobacter paludis]PWS31577.1 hypothetical protein DF947_13385 [Pedobacter paludis]